MGRKRKSGAVCLTRVGHEMVEANMALATYAVGRLWHRRDVRRLGRDEALALAALGLCRATAWANGCAETWPSYALKAIFGEVLRAARDGGVIHVPEDVARGKAQSGDGGSQAARYSAAQGARRAVCFADVATPDGHGPADFLPDRGAAAGADDAEDAGRLLSCLEPRLRDLLLWRYGGLTLAESAARLGVNRSRAHQLEGAALEKLRKSLGQPVAAPGRGRAT